MDVGAWLRNLGLGQYEAAFRDNSVDADILPRLTGEDLRELGIARVGHRRKLLDAILELRSGTPASAAPTEVMGSSSTTQAAAPARVSEVSAERRPITVMFCDLVGSTSLAAKLDAEDWRSLVNAYLDEALQSTARIGSPQASSSFNRSKGSQRAPRAPNSASLARSVAAKPALRRTSSRRLGQKRFFGRTAGMVWEAGLQGQRGKARCPPF
jgi:hypothetical protein